MFPEIYEPVLKIVEDLNNAYMEVKGLAPFYITTDGVSVGVFFLEAPLWCSAEDEREYDEEKEEYEPLEDYLKRELRNLAKNILEVFPE
jgi:hypothetical protein